MALSTVAVAQKPAAELGLFPVSVRWSKTLDVNVVGSPVFDDTRIFILLADGHLAAFAMDDGRELWRVERDISIPPVAGDGRVFFATDSELAALDAETGELAWETRLDAPLAVPVTAGHGWTLLGGATGVVNALRTTDGSRVWSRDVASPPSQSVAVTAAHVYVPVRDGRVVALNLEDGAPAWERRIGGTPQPILALDDRLYVGSDDNYLYCLMTSNGRVDWRWRTGGDIIGRPAFDDQRVYFASKDNVLRALDRRNGAQRWKKPLPLRPTTGPLAVQNAVLVAGLGSSVQGFQMRDGGAAGDFDAGGPLAAPPQRLASEQKILPTVVYVTRSMTTGPTIAAVTRNVEPQITPVAPLPNPVPVAPLPAAASPSGSPGPEAAPPRSSR